MQRTALAVLVACLVLPLAALGAVVGTVPAVSAAHTCEVRVWVNGAPTGPKVAVDPARYPELCGAEPATPTATNTPVPSSGVTLGWHAPGAHDGLNVHEHGDAPPAWVLNSANPPFSQDRESHTGYKGVYDVSPGGAESYFIAHIVATEGARSHGDHDYQLWLRATDGSVAYDAGVLDFGNPPPERTSDTGERPIILSVGDGGCETWYSRPGSTVMDVGWTICGRYQSFDGTVRGGVGTFRTIDWIIPCDRLPAGTPLLSSCRTEFGVSRLSFIVNSRDYNVPGVTITPIN